MEKLIYRFLIPIVLKISRKESVGLVFSQALHGLSHHSCSISSYTTVKCLKHRALHGKNTGMIAESGLEWTLETFRNFSPAGRFLSMYGKQLAARDWNPERSARKVARAELALKLCNDSSLVIEHLVSDTWIDFNKWYTNLKMSAALPAPKRRKKAYEVIIRKGGRVFVDGREPVQIAEDIPDQERKDIAKLVRDYYLSKS